MAKCTYKLPEDLLKKLSTLGSKMDEISEVVLEAGGEVVLDKVKSNLEGSAKVTPSSKRFCAAFFW